MMLNGKNDTTGIANAMKELNLSSSMKEDEEGGGEDAALPPEVIAQVAEYCSAKDQLSIKLLCKGVKDAMPKIPVLNLAHFIEAFMKVVRNKRIGSVKFELHPLVVGREPFTLLDFISMYFKKVFSQISMLFVDHVFWFKLLSDLLGDYFQATLETVFHQPKHPKFSLLSLPMAAYGNYLPAMNFLLLPANRGTIPGLDFHHALYLSSRVGCPEALKILIDLQDRLADPSIGFDCPIRTAAMEGNASCVELLLKDQRVNPAAFANDAIHLPVKYERMETFLLILNDRRVNPSDNDNECIRTATLNGNFEMFRILLSHPRVSPISKDNECIRTASSLGHTAIVRLLLADPRVDASACKNYALQSARTNGHLEVVELLEEHLTIRGIAF